MKKLSIIIPVFNEEKTIDAVITKVKKTTISGIKKEIVVVDDGSSDHTHNLLEKHHGLILITHKKNSGKGGAIKTGLVKASGDFILIQDADLEYDPKYYGVLLEPIIENKAKVVFGSRLKNYPLNLWGKNKTVLPTHLIANKFLTLLTNLLYGSNLTDMETGYKVFKKEVINGLKLNSRKFDFEAEVTAKILKKRVKIIEIPILTSPRTYKEGKKIGWKDGLSAIWTLIKYRFTN